MYVQARVIVRHPFQVLLVAAEPPPESPPPRNPLGLRSDDELLRREPRLTRQRVELLLPHVLTPA